MRKLVIYHHYYFVSFHARVCFNLPTFHAYLEAKVRALTLSRAMQYEIISNVASNVKLFIEPSMEVGEVRGLVSAMITSCLQEQNVRLTFQGHQLVNDSETWATVLELYPLPEGAPRKIFACVTSKRVAGAPSLSEASAALSSMNRSERKSSRAEVQRVEQLLDFLYEKPDVFEAMISSFPGVKRFIDTNPDIAQMLRDREAVKGIIMSKIDPTQNQLMNKSLQVRSAQLSAIPGAVQLSERYIHDHMTDLENDLATVWNGGGQGANDGAAGPDSTKEANNGTPSSAPGQVTADGRVTQPLAGDVGNLKSEPMGVTVDGRGSGNSDGSLFATAAKDLIPTLTRYPSPSTATGADGASHAAVPFETPTQNESISHNASETVGMASATGDVARWSSQLALLKDMGFDNEAQCLEALRAANGDVDKAACFIIDENDL
ncbi:hypothetical protein TRVL_07730 [Trypanosoma vivax]|nr:hypothetical protein TRVL_07730 [Trypanosoma vivax]